MTLDQLRKAVARGSPANAADLVAQDPAVQEASKARTALEASGKVLGNQQTEVVAEVKTLKANIEGFKDRHTWLGRWWYGKELKKLQSELGKQQAEAKSLAKALKDLAKEHKAAVQLEAKVRTLARPGAEREAQRQQELYQVLTAAYERRNERERSQERDRGRGGRGE